MARFSEGGGREGRAGNHGCKFYMSMEKEIGRGGMEMDGAIDQQRQTSKEMAD